jgi:hypothetical protein
VRVLARNVGLPREVLRRWAVAGITAAHLDGALAPGVSFEGPTASSPRGVVVELEATDHVPGLDGRVSLQSRMSLRSAKYQRPSIFAKLSR